MLLIALVAGLLDSPAAAPSSLWFDGGDTVRVPANYDICPLTVEVQATVENLGWLGDTDFKYKGGLVAAGTLDHAWAFSVVGNKSFGSLTQVCLHVDVNSPYFVITSNTHFISASRNIGTGVCHHLAFTYDSNSVSFYVDGEFDTNVPTGVGIEPVTNSYLAFGDDPAWTPEYLTGNLSEVRIWNRVLTAEELRSNVNRRVFSDAPGLVGYWRFDEGAGQIVTDASPSQAHGHLGTSPAAGSDDPTWRRSDCAVQDRVEIRSIAGSRTNLALAWRSTSAPMPFVVEMATDPTLEAWTWSPPTNQWPLYATNWDAAPEGWPAAAILRVATRPPPLTHPIEGFETGDFSHWAWSFTGSPWLVVTNTPHSGAFAAASPPIGHGTSTAMRVEVNCSSGTMSFAYRTSTENSFDKLGFYLDGQSKGLWSGIRNWAVTQFVVSAGTHELLWSYTKDGSVTGGVDTVWIDSITLP